MLELKNVFVTYDPNTIFTSDALVDISLKIKKNESVGIVGRIGSGKSTLIQLFNGLIKPDKGIVLLDNIDINSKQVDIRKVRKKVGIVFQYPEEQFFAETVFDEVAFGPKNMGMREIVLKNAVFSALKEMGFSSEKIAKHSPFSLSGGEKRRVAIASIIAMNPDILVLDEPMAGMDFDGKEKLIKYIKNEIKNGRTIVFVTHNMEELLEIADRVIALDEGRKVFDGRVRDFFSDKELIEKIGIDIPSVVKIRNKLEKCYPDIPFCRTPLEISSYLKKRYRP